MSIPQLDAWQFRLNRIPTSQSVPVGDYSLETGPDIELVDVSDRTGQPVGWLIGFPINLVENETVTSGLKLPFELGANPDEFAEQVLSALGGRFLWIATLNGALRIYLDCFAMVPCVFDPVLKIAGSTADALFDDAEYQERYDADAFKRFGVQGDGWFPAGLTAHRGLERLLPNHYLDLQTWTVKRHWPLREIEVTPDPNGAVAEIVSLVQQQLDILVKGEKKVAFALTAGRDTRLLLACARSNTEQVTFTTVVGEDSHATDSVMARTISRMYDLNHLELPRTTANQVDHDRYMRRGGHCMGDTNSWFHPSVHPIAKDHIMVGGLGGEVARGFLWGTSDTESTVITAENLAGRMGLRSEPELTPRLARWLDNAPVTNSLIMLDIAYIEQRMGPWAAAQFYSDPTMIRYHPLLTRRIVELMLSLPNDWKRSANFASEVIEQAWPELLKLPFNSLGMWKDTMLKIQRAMSDPGLVIKKIRKVINQ